jgi:hypothetical protein
MSLRICGLSFVSVAAVVLSAVQARAFADPIEAQTLTYRTVHSSQDAQRAEAGTSLADAGGSTLTVQPVQWGYGGFGLSIGIGRPYYGGYYGSYYRPYGSFYRPYYGGYYSSFYRPYRPYSYGYGYASYYPSYYGYTGYYPYSSGYYGSYYPSYYGYGGGYGGGYGYGGCCGCY